jgi:hypothetical protein
MGQLFTDAELGKDPSEEIVGRELAGDLGKRVLRLAQFFRQELAGAALGQGGSAGGEMTPGPGDRIEMPLPRRIDALAEIACARYRFQVFPQSIDTGPGSGRDGDDRGFARFEPGRVVREVDLVPDDRQHCTVRKGFVRFIGQLGGVLHPQARIGIS